MENYILTTTIPKRYGGRTHALLERCSILNAEGCHFTVLVNNIDADFARNFSRAKRRYSLGKKTTLINIYDDIISKPLERASIIDYLPFQVGRKRVRRGKSVYFYQENKLVCKKTYYDFFLIRIKTIKNYRKRASVERFFDRSGWLRYVKTFRGDQLKKIVFRSQSGESLVCLRYRYGDIQSVTVSGCLAIPDAIFDRYEAFLTAWYQNIIPKGSNVIVDVRELYPAIAAYKWQCHRIFHVHGHHYNLPFSRGEHAYPNLKSSISKFDSVVVLTNHQKIRLSEDYKIPLHKIHFIPYFPKNITRPIEVRSNVISVVSRFVSHKNLQDVILGFSLFSKNYPGFSLEIYGFGEEEQCLSELVDSLDLNNVRFMGAVNDSLQIFSKSFATVHTSMSEGFGLTCMEAISVGCPVVSYNIEFGPSFMISHGKNGLLTEENTPQALAESLEKLVQSGVTMVQEELISGDAVRNYLPPEMTYTNYVTSWIGLLGYNYKHHLNP